MGNGYQGEYLLSDSSGLVVSTAKEIADTVRMTESTVVRWQGTWRGFLI
jgi:hypothetical protein